VYAEILERVSARVARLPTGDPLDRSVVVGPVIDDRACGSILQYIDVGRTEGRLIAGGAHRSLDSYLIEPTVFVDVAPDARIAQEEIFGPVLACLRARNFDDALRIANGTRYGLTGAVFSRNRAKLEQARREFHVGNLYFNRKSTGALMGVHPFGGFNLSGTDSKAGGPDYLLHFLQGKSVGDRVA
jgi:1-pyrroline-5-carboxylate dehydrogenase